MQRHVLQHDGTEREYFVHVPPGAEGPLPLVVAIHGYTSTATGFEAAHNLNPHADEHGYIVAYPQGSHFIAEFPNGAYRVTSWNDLAANQPPTIAGPHCMEEHAEYACPPECGECSRCGWTACYDDVGFIAKMLDEIQSGYSADPTRTYLLGVSNGGMMALRLGCNLSGRFAAVAPIIGQLAPGYACGPDTNLPMLHLFGALDTTVQPDGKPGSDGFIYTTATDTARVWAESLSCQKGPERWANDFSDNAGLLCSAHSDCQVAGQQVVSCMDPDGAHDWPEQRISKIPATCVAPDQQDVMPDRPPCPVTDERVHKGMDVVWNFFSRYASNSN